MKALPSVTQPLTLGFALKSLYQRSLAKLAGYRAAVPSPTTSVGSRIGTNSNSSFASIQRVGMGFTAEEIAKNCPIGGAYLYQRANYCSSVIQYIPDTGDEKLNEDMKLYLQGDDGCGGMFGRMGNNCSMQDAFSRTVDREQPVRGDAGMCFYRDEYDNLKLMEFSADQLGEPYSFTGPQYNSDGSWYFAGRYFSPSGECVAYKIYERRDSWYGNPRIYPASDVIYVQDPSDFRGVRGVTKFANAIIHMEKGETLFQYGMDAAQRQAKTAYWVTNARGEGNPDVGYEGEGGISYPDPSIRYFERFGDGPVNEYGYTGDTMDAMKVEMPGPELIAGCEFSDQRVAIALGLTYSFLVSPEKVGGAPSRLDVNKVTKEFKRIQNRIHRPALHKIKLLTILDACRQGYFPMIPTITRGTFMLPVSPTADAFYDAKENIQNLRSGLESPQEICAETNRDWNMVRRAKIQAAVEVAKDVEEANDALKKAGFEARITSHDVMQLTDNPYQASVAEQLEKGVDTSGNPPERIDAKTSRAQMAAYMGDVTVGDLPNDTRNEIARILGTNGHTDSLKAVKYGMVASELEPMADPHNLESARKNLRYCTNGSCADEVHANEEKHILINNGRVVDGHHYLAKALKGKVTKSLHVIDLTPARFQAQMSNWDESKHPRDPAGTSTGGQFASGGEDIDPSLEEPNFRDIRLSEVAKEAKEMVPEDDPHSPPLNPFDNDLDVPYVAMRTKDSMDAANKDIYDSRVRVRIRDGAHRIRGMVRWAEKNGMDMSDIKIQVVTVNDRKLLSGLRKPDFPDEEVAHEAARDEVYSRAEKNWERDRKKPKAP